MSYTSACTGQTVECLCGTKFYYCCGRECYSDLLHAESRFSRYVPFISCPKLWKSKSERLFIHTIITLVIILLSPIAIIALPFAAIACCLYLKYFAADE